MELSAMSSFTIKRRRPRFTVEELKALVSAVEKVKPVLYDSRMSSSVLNSDVSIVRDRAWKEICKSVNAVSQTQRTLPEIKKKWADWSSVVKKKTLELDPNEAAHQDEDPVSSKFITPTERRLLGILEFKDGQGEKNINYNAQVKQEAANTSREDVSMDNALGFSDSEQDFSAPDTVTVHFGDVSEDPEGNTSQQPESLDPRTIGSENASTDASQSQLLDHNINSGFIDESHATAQNINSSTRSVKSKRIVKHSDVLLALKRKKLRMLEEQIKVEKERLQVEKGILHILKELKAKKDNEKCQI